jgi:DNA-binding SARP family transcriptional activator
LKGSADGLPERGDTAGLVRPRLIARLLDPAAFQVGVVAAPAGSGKSRLLAHVALAAPGPVAWCGTPDPVPRSEQALAGWLWDGLGPGLEANRGARPGGLQGILDALAGPGPDLLVMVDDVHLLEGSDAELALADLIRRLPARMRLVMASRVDLGLDLSRLRVSGQLVEIGPDDLRFRAWEVEELFRDVYHEPLIPEDVATLARRTAGWAAYLQLFHLATARKPLAEKRQVLASLANRARLVQEYLTRHVLAELSPDLQDFLIRTSVLRRPTVALCDELLGWEQGSRELLTELERRQLFTDRVDDDSYRYHTVLLSYLEARLVEAVGPKAARQEHRQAALLLERDGLTEEAAAAFAKAEDWEGVARTMGHPGESAAILGEAWLEALPPTVVETDALLLMARARRSLASGALGDAVATMRLAEKVAASTVVAERCRRERDQIAAWMSPARPGGRDWLALLRLATQRQPREAQRAAAALSGPTGRLAEGTAAFLAGDMLTSSRLLRGVPAHPNASPAMTAGAQLLAMVAESRCGRVPQDDEIDRLRDEVEAAAVPWLDRMARAAVVAADGGSGGALDDIADACQREGDRWGEGLVAFLHGTTSLSRGAPEAASLERAARVFGDLGAGVCEVAAQAYLALSAHLAGDRELAARTAQHVRTVAATLEVPGAVGGAALAMARVFDDAGELTRARDLLEPLGTWVWHRELGLRRPGPHSVPPAAAPSGDRANGDRANGDRASGDRARGDWSGAEFTAGPPDAAMAAPGGWSAADPGQPLQLRCFGGFSLDVGGRPFDEAAAKPMERALLHLLAARAGEPVHREALMEALWPEAAPDAGLHRLQVAISSLRRLLAVGPAETVPRLTREGDSYRLALPDDAECDVWQFDAHLRRAARARSTGSDAIEEEALAAALGAYGGPLLPGDGPADWVVDRRAAFQLAAVDAAARLAYLRLSQGQHREATEAARVGLSLDRYRDELWRLLIEAADRSGHHAEAGQARRAYAAVLGELGV